jgi:hypothetical protein
VAVLCGGVRELVGDMQRLGPLLLATASESSNKSMTMEEAGLRGMDTHLWGKPPQPA